MSFKIFDLITLLFSVIGYFYSFKFFKNGKYEISLILIILCGLLLRIFTSGDLYLHEWDERYHALVAKNFLKHPLIPTLFDKPAIWHDPQIWIGTHIWLHKPPVPLWMMALFLKIFGVNEIALRIPSIILSTLGIFLTFSISDFFTKSKKVSFVAAFLFSINGLIIELTSGRIPTDHYDLMFLVFIELCIYFAIKYILKDNNLYTIWCGISLGLAILTKWLPALIVFPVIFFLMSNTNEGFIKINTVRIFKFLFIVFICSMIIVLPWEFYIYKKFPLDSKIADSFIFKHITEVLEKGGSPFYYIDKIRINYGELIYLPLIYLLIRYVLDFKNKLLIGLLIWIWIPIIFFSFVETKMQGYILFICPAIFIATGMFWEYLQALKVNRSLRWFKTLISLLLFLLPIRYSIERIKFFDKSDRNPTWVKDLKSFNSLHNDENGIIFNYPRPIEAMFYTNFMVYSELPPNYQLKELVENGQNIFINLNEATLNTINKTQILGNDSLLLSHIKLIKIRSLN